MAAPAHPRLRDVPIGINAAGRRRETDSMGEIDVGQSSNDTFPTAMHVASLLELERHLLPHAEALSAVMLVTALSPAIGYDRASAIAHQANDENLTLKEAALES